MRKTTLAAIAAVMLLPAEPNDGVGFPRDYRRWANIKSAVIGSASPLFATEGGIHHIYANSVALEGYRTGKFPDGSVLVFELLETNERLGVASEGAERRLDTMVKDSGRFPSTGGWGYARFVGGERTIDPLGAGAEKCHACHQERKNRDYVFGEFRKSATALTAGWDARLAARYLDRRQQEWSDWPAAKTPGGPCISCHTGVTYIVARRALRRALGEPGPVSFETGLLDGVRARLHGNERATMFPGLNRGPLAPQAEGVEAVLSAFAAAKMREHAEQPGETERLAFERLWTLQLHEGAGKGAWAWFNLKLEPWETADSQYYGATLAAVAAGSMPPSYTGQPENRQRIEELTAYLRRERERQPLHNRMMLLWASATLPGVLSDGEKSALAAEVWRAQLGEGAWPLGGAAPNDYATGLAAFALEQAGAGCSEPRLGRALDWLKSRQDRHTGAWSAVSLNKTYPPNSMESQFMNDAATGFAVLALLADGNCR